MTISLNHHLDALKQVLSSPAVAQIQDAALLAQLRMADRVVSQLLVEQTALPELEKSALSAFASAVEGVDVLLRRFGLPADSVSILRQLAVSGEATIDAMLAPATILLQQLNAINDPQAKDYARALYKVEQDFRAACSAALEERVAPLKVTGIQPKLAKPIDKARFNDFLRAAFPDEPGVSLASYSFIAGGTSKFTALVCLDGACSLPSTLIMRGDGPGTFGGKSVSHEFRMLQALAGAGVKAPRPFALDAAGDVMETPIMLVEQLQGAVIGHMFQLPPANATLSRDTATQLARIHTASVDAMRDVGCVSDLSNRDKTRALLDESYRAFKGIDRPSVNLEAAFRWLFDNIDLFNEPQALVHGDFGFHNLLVLNDKVNAILDWEFADVGNPAYDLGYFYDQAVSLGSWKEFLYAYHEAGGPVFTSDQMDYAILFANTRLAVMNLQTDMLLEQGVSTGIVASVMRAGNVDTAIGRVAAVLDRVF